MGNRFSVECVSYPGPATACTWIVSRDRPWLVCSAARAAPDKPYCALHSALAMSPPGVYDALSSADMQAAWGAMPETQRRAALYLRPTELRALLIEAARAVRGAVTARTGDHML